MCEGSIAFRAPHSKATPDGATFVAMNGNDPGIVPGRLLRHSERRGRDAPDANPWPHNYELL